jgi:lipopolysaccharide transport system ATP-binding protein
VSKSVPIHENADPPVEPDAAVVAENLGKLYRLWKSPAARFHYSILREIRRALGCVLPDDSRLLAMLDRRRVALGQDFHALREASITVGSGESVGIIGRNGSGKSTLLQMIAGTLRPTSGSVRVRGRVAALLELGSGFNPEFTGRENVFLNAAILGISQAEIAARFEAVEKFADIGVFIDQPIKNYSSGMVVRLAFAVLTQIEPDILIVDEALAVGDFLFQQKCFDRIRELKARGTTFLFVSHGLATVLELCPRALWLDKGRLMFDGPSKEAADLYEASALCSRSAAEGAALLHIHQSASKAAGTESATAPAPEMDSAEIAALMAESETNAEAGSTSSPDVDLRFVAISAAHDRSGGVRSWFTSEEEVVLSIGIVSRRALDDPHVGFKIRDRLGRVLFETSSLGLRQYAGHLAAGELLVSQFQFALPFQPGEYSVTIGFANGALGTTDFAEALLRQFDAKTFEIVKNRSSIDWLGFVNLRPTLAYSKMRVPAAPQHAIPEASALPK